MSPYLKYIEVKYQNRLMVLSYETFGEKLYSAPVILVNHALTGNSTVCGENGWWKDLIGKEKAINTNKYTILSFNIPGNGYGNELIDDYKSMNIKQVAQLFVLGIKALEINKLFAIIGGSLGGGIAWQMASLEPQITTHLIPVATHYESSDWIIANCLIQEQLLLNSNQPIHDARLHAMLCYRNPESFKLRFNRTMHKELNRFNVESWLLHHGKKLQERFQTSAYKLMNHLLRTIQVENLEDIQAQITLVGIDSDLFFTPQDIKESFKKLKELNKKVNYYEITSVHGHDAFLIAYKQLTQIIAPIFR